MFEEFPTRNVQKNSTQEDEKLSTRNVRKKIDPKCPKKFRSFEKKSTQQDEKFSTQESRKNFEARMESFAHT